MEPLAEPPIDSAGVVPAVPSEPPGGYVTYDEVYDGRVRLDRGMFALAILCGLYGATVSFGLMAIAAATDGYPWTSWESGAGLHLLTVTVLALATSLLSAQGIGVGRATAVLFALAAVAWIVADVINSDLPQFADDGGYRTAVYLQALGQVTFPIGALFLAGVANSRPRQPRVRQPRFDPYTLNPYDDHVAFEGPQPSTQAADVASETTVDDSDEVWRRNDA